MTHGPNPANGPLNDPANGNVSGGAGGFTNDATSPRANMVATDKPAAPATAGGDGLVASEKKGKKPGKRWPDGKNGWGASAVFGLFQTILGAIGLFMSFLITIEKIQLAADPEFVPSCTIDAILQCTSVMESPQASAFGFPNPLIGLMGFSVIIALGVVLMVGARFPRWIWWGQAIGLFLGVVFVHWLAYNAIYEIIALCPYCMVVWAVTMPLFVMTVVHMARDKARAKREYAGGNFFLPLLVVLAWYAAVFLLIWMQFYA